jgi:valyl-tRNA synthetase
VLFIRQNHSAVVKEAFVQLYESGLISRADGIVNWCCALESSVADVEVDDVDFKGRLTMRVPGYEMPVEFGLLYFCGYKFEDSGKTILVIGNIEWWSIFWELQTSYSF